MQTFEYVALAVLMLGFITYRQTRWQSVRLSKLLRMPAILLVAALATIQTSARLLGAGWHPGARDLALVGVELGLGLVGGVLMGRWTQIRTQGDDVVSRVVGRGLAVWVGFIVIRVALGVLGSVLGAPLGSMPSTILVVIAVVKLAQALVVRTRVARHLASSSPRVRVGV